MNNKQAVILGAGFQGICAALALYKEGYHVTLIDKMPDCMLRASLRNEGKIHLGFVYANDSSFQSAALMLHAALVFAPLLEKWLERQIDWEALKSRPFVYGIAHQSMLSNDELYAHYERLQTRYNATLRDSNVSYLGSRPQRLWHQIPRMAYQDRFHQLVYGEGRLLAEFVQTAEIALDLPRFRKLLCEHLQCIAAEKGHASIETRYNHTVCSVRRTATGFRVEGSRADGTSWQIESDIVVNCLWEGRMQLDQTLGIRPQRPWVYRLKYRLLGTLPPQLIELPSFTFVLGPYGDIVTYPSGRCYFSWYPAGMLGWSTNLTPPAKWNAACNGHVEAHQRKSIIYNSLDALAQIVPGIDKADIEIVDAGIIFSWGSTDIDDQSSILHKRYEIGVQAHDGYYSIDTGKYTSAPHFAQQLVEELRS